MQRKNSKVDVLLYSIIGLIIVIEYILSSSVDVNQSVCITFFMIGMISYAAFVMDKEFMSVNKLILIYFFVFGYFAPIKQYVSEYNAWKLVSFTDDDWLYANGIVLTFLITYVVCKNFVFKYIGESRKKRITFFHSQPYINKNVLYAFMLLSVLCFGYLIKKGMLIDMGEVSTALNEESNTITSFFDKVIRFLPVAVIEIVIIFQKKNMINCSRGALMIYYIFSGLIAFMIFFPFNGTISRFFLFGVYIIMCATIFDKAKHNSLIIIAALIGFYYIFPAFNFFKTHSMDDLSEFALGGLNFNFVDYDAHQVLMISKKYTEQFGFLNGKNLLTALFCMIPRSIWSGKLEHSGVLVSEAFKANFTNLSCPIYAEFYLAFGIVGVIIGAVALAYVVRLLEAAKKNENMPQYGICNICIGMAIYCMRGAMLPTTAYMFGLIISFMIAYFIYLIIGTKKSGGHINGK